MEKCKFDVMSTQQTTKKNIISMVLFFTEKNKYKSNLIYYLGLQRFLRNESLKFKDCNIVVFVDEYALQQVEISKVLNRATAQFPQLTLIKFDCPQFKETAADIMHLEFIPTTLRFFPLFTNKQFKKYKQVLVLDTELPLDIVNSIYKVSQSQKDFDFCFHDIQNHAQKKPEQYYISAGTIISNIKLPNKLFDTFMINYSKDPTIYENLFQKQKSHKFDPEHKFPYGIDEMFLNSEVKGYLKNKKILVIHMYSINNFIADNYGYMIKNQETALTYLTKITSLDTNNIKEHINSIQTHKWSEDTQIDKKRDIARKFYDVVNDLYKKKSNEFLPISYLQWIVLNYDNVMYQITGFTIQKDIIKKTKIIQQIKT